MIPLRPTNKVQFAEIDWREARRILIYGTGGIGKTTLACQAPGPVAFFDLDGSLSSLRSGLADVPLPKVIPNAKDWVGLSSALHSPGWGGIKTIVIDSITVAEEWCIQFCLRNVKTFDKPPVKAESLEDYGYGKDVRVVFENFIPLLDDLQAHYLDGRNIILIAHDCKPEEVNPMGANYVRWEPRLRSSKKGENSIRFKVKEWCDFVGCMLFDISAKVEQDKKTAERTKKALGVGNRTLYLSELPYLMAKNRGCAGPIDIVPGKNPWDEILK